MARCRSILPWRYPLSFLKLEVVLCFAEPDHRYRGGRAVKHLDLNNGESPVRVDLCLRLVVGFLAGSKIPPRDSRRDLRATFILDDHAALPIRQD